MVALARILLLAAAATAAPAFAASELRPAPEGSFAGAPSEYTRFSSRELARGFLALAFGSDFRLGSKLQRVHRFDDAVRIHLIASGSVDRLSSYRRIVDEFAREFPQLRLSVTDDAYSANLVVRLIDEKDFATAIRAAFGIETARAFIAKTDAQCMTSVKSAAEGGIMRVDSFIIVDQGDEVFFNCAYHEMLHALGLPNHDQRNPWTALNQVRTVGYLTVYDRSLLRILYAPAIQSGMNRAQLLSVLPALTKEIAGER